MPTIFNFRRELLNILKNENKYEALKMEINITS